MSARRYCQQCANRGLIRLGYRSGEPSDVVLCDCPAGQVWRYVGEAVVRQRLGLSDAQQVGLREDLDGEDVPPPVSGETFVAAGKTAKRAKL